LEVCYDAGQTTPPSPLRKPAPGMLLRAAETLRLDLGRSWMIGDRWRDIDAGRAAGCRTIFLDRGYAEELRQTPDFTARSLAEAAGIILARPLAVT
ncbi:MAG: HAD hydrolase-like protein, partial [Candidatus Didemnitutus sp.]|nr:HAD hydrolase-like protein [Candidatus Didemnitutus sp.]